MLTLYFVGGMALVPLLFKNFYKSFIDAFSSGPTLRDRMPALIRFSIVVAFLLVMVGVPIKMYLRWGFSLKYIVFIPEYFTNI